MTKRVLILTELIAPYRIPVFNALSLHPGVDLHVLFLARTDPSLREWRVYEDEIRFSYDVLPSWRKRIGGQNILFNFHVEKTLADSRPDVIVCGGYSHLAFWQALRWARRNGLKFILWSESTGNDRRNRHTFVEFMKNVFLRHCDAFVVPGLSAREYVESFGVLEKDIFVARNAVDTELFATIADQARNDASRVRHQLQLPKRYFLYVGRLVPEKGVLDLLDAYKSLSEQMREEFGLVIAGDGPARADLEFAARSIKPGMIRFAGFVHREELPIYYGLAECLVMPTHTDPWGLVVNEAMACSLPVICTTVAGCAKDLIRENGLLIEAGNIAQLAESMSSVARDSQLRVGMAKKSAAIIRQYSPRDWADGMVHAALQVKAQ